MLDVQLHVSGLKDSLADVRHAMNGHNLRGLSFHQALQLQPASPSPLLSTPPLPLSPLSPQLPSLSTPFQQHQPSWLSFASTPNNSPTCSTPKRRKLDYSPPPISQDSDETRLNYSPSPQPTDSDETRLDYSPSPQPSDSDETRLDYSPSPQPSDSDETRLDYSPSPQPSDSDETTCLFLTPSLQSKQHDFSPELFDSPSVSFHNSTIDLSPRRRRPAFRPRSSISRVLFPLSGDTTPELSPKHSP